MIIINGKVLNKNKGTCLTLGNVIKETNKMNSVNVNCDILPNERKHKVTIIGDSHLRGSVLGIKDHLSNNFEVFGFIKPGAGIGQILHSLEVEYTNLTKEDVIVFSGGSNDVGLNKLNSALVQISKFVQVNNNNTNRIVLGEVVNRGRCFSRGLA